MTTTTYRDNMDPTRLVRPIADGPLPPSGSVLCRVYWQEPRPDGGPPVPMLFGGCAPVPVRLLGDGSGAGFSVVAASW